MAKVVELHPTEKEIEYHKNRIRPVFQARLKKENVEEEIEKVIQDCIKGWPSAPKSFAVRVSKRAKLYGVDGENKRFLLAKKERKILTPDERREQKIKKFADFIEPVIKKLNVRERKQFFNRLEFYMDEFEFNYSSDLSLLSQLILSEIYIQGLQLQLLKSDTTREKSDISRAITNFTSNVIDLQKRLGITREQRQKGMGGTEGSVAEISLKLDEKLKEREKQKIREEDRERMLYEAKLRRDDINKIPTDKRELAEILRREEEIESNV